MPRLSSDISGAAVGPEDLGRLIRRDQLAALRRSMRTAVPANMVLALAAAVVAVQSGQGLAGGLWFSASIAANLLRIALCRGPGAGPFPQGAGETGEAVDRLLRRCWLTALLSGLVWAFLPVLCAGYTSPQTLFYLTLVCGTTAGAITHGTAFARMPACFITPPLLSMVGCLLWAGGFDRICLAATVLLYLVALIRSAFESEVGFREASRLKNEATALAQSRAEAHASVSVLADEMARRATHDDLTGLLNRAGFMRSAEAALLAPGTERCLLLLDLDGFKSVNDVYGHETGDRVLAEVARRLRAVLPPEALAARIGGDEFAVLYVPARADVTYPALAAGIIAAIAAPFAGFDAGRLGISIGIAVATAETRADGLAEMLSAADEALYAAKAGGRNRFRLFDDGLRGRRAIRRDSERDLSQALADDALAVWFQPIYAGDGRRLAGLEALVRWRHPVHGWIPPGDIVAAAAMAGLTEALLRAVLDRVCAMIAVLRAAGRGDVRVAMNVSPREMAQVPVDEIVLDRLATLGLPAPMLEIEITEETALDIGAVQAKLQALARAGLPIALDDFGTGYASLASLRQLQAKRIKIDRSFVTGLTGSDDKLGLVQAVLGLGRWLDLEVVAEGVETADDLATLQALGCPFVQGYHLGRPMPAEAVAATLLGVRAAA